MKIKILQKDNTRYTMMEQAGMMKVNREVCFGTGASFDYDYMSVSEAWNLYDLLISHGYNEFRNIREVSWYATRPNNTPYEEEWKIEGGCFVPIKSRVLERRK